MNALLRMQSETREGAVDHFVREWMKQVREVAYDAEDCIDLYVCRCRVRWRLRDGVLSWARHLASTLFPRRRLAGDVKALRARATVISECHGRYGVNREEFRGASAAALAPMSPVVSSNALQPTNGSDEFVGIEGQANTLADKLKAVGERSNLRVLSIVGFGGLGKTTLAVEVCRKLEAVFQHQAMVSVSQAFDPSKDLQVLLKRILVQVIKPKTSKEKGIKEQHSEESVSDMDTMDVGRLASKLEELLNGMRYLIVIDDVWTTSAWNAIRSKLPENYCGSVIMVTTRIDTVAKACSSPSVYGDYLYKINPLSAEDAEKLFLSRAFGSKEACCPMELKKVMDSILKKCAGLPLAIVSIASLLSSYRSSGSIRMWERISSSIDSQMELHTTLEGMKQIVTLSYSHLPHHLKSCMLYLSIFPEDYVIKKKRLLLRWIAEGFVIEKRGLTTLEVADSYYDELVSRNLIDPARSRFDGAVKAVKVHDMQLEVQVSKSMEENFVIFVGAQCGGTPSYDSVRRLTVHGDGPKPAIEAMSMQHVRSLSTFGPQGKKAVLHRLAEFALLKVLDMEDCKEVKNHHVKCICCRLFLLRFLSLRNTDVTTLPRQISRLQHMQTLNLYDTNLQDLPSSLTKLTRLEYLFFSNRSTWRIRWKMQRGLQRMKTLRMLRKVSLMDDPKVAEEMGALTQLQMLAIVVHTSDEEVLANLAGALDKTNYLRSLYATDVDDETTRLNTVRNVDEENFYRNHTV